MVCLGEKPTHRIKQMSHVVNGSAKNLPLETKVESQEISWQFACQLFARVETALILGAIVFTFISGGLKNLPGNTQLQPAVNSTTPIESPATK